MKSGEKCTSKKKSTTLFLLWSPHFITQLKVDEGCEVAYRKREAGSSGRQREVYRGCEVTYHKRKKLSHSCQTVDLTKSTRVAM